MALSAQRRAITPRPSISPLSTRDTSPQPPSDTPRRPKRSYDETEMARALGAAGDEEEAEIGGGHRDDEERSSSLSEPEDEHEEEADGVDSDAIGNIGDRTRRTGLQRSLDVDSDAETERLELTPQRSRRHNDNLGRTPSKLSQTATAEDDLSDPPSPVPAGAGNASSTSTLTTAGQKRKRSDTADSSLTSADSDIASSPRKRKHAAPAEEPMGPSEMLDDTNEVRDPAERAEATPLDEEPTSIRPAPTKPTKGRRGKPGRGRKPKSPILEPEHPLPTSEPPETIPPIEEPSEEDPVKTEEHRKMKKEASTTYTVLLKHFRGFKEKLYTERLAALDEELRLLSPPPQTAHQTAPPEHPEYSRQAATVDTRLQKQIRETHAHYNYKLRSIRDRVLAERSQIHAQYFQRVRGIRETALERLGEAWYALQKERRRSPGGIGEEGEDKNHLYMFPEKRGERLRQQASWNREVSVLSGVAKWVGWPAAPEVKGVEGEAGEGDLRGMKISRRINTTTTTQPPTQISQHQHQLPPPQTQSSTLTQALTGSQPLSLTGAQSLPQPQSQNQPQNQPPPPPQPAPATTPRPLPLVSYTANERLAHEQYLEQNAWARPQTSSMLAHSTPLVAHTHTPDWAAPSLSAGSSAGKFRNAVAGSMRFGREREKAEEKANKSPRISSSPIVANKVRENGFAVASDPHGVPGFRNISGVSGVSTIDAPDEEVARAAAEEQEKQRDKIASGPLPGLPVDDSGTQQIHRYPPADDKEKEERGHSFSSAGAVGGGVGFMRAAAPAGAFGTPTPGPGVLRVEGEKAGS